MSIPPQTPDDKPRPPRDSDLILADWLRKGGESELVIAETLIGAIVLAAQSVRDGRAEDPATFPGYIGDTDHASIARRTIATLLNIGWTAPAGAA